jgi:hypothetical protein
MYVVNKVQETLTERVSKRLEEMKNIECIHSITIKESPHTMDCLKLVIRMDRESNEDEVINIALYVFSDTVEGELRITPFAKTPASIAAELRETDLSLTRESLLEYVLQGIVLSTEYRLAPRPRTWDETDEDS